MRPLNSWSGLFYSYLDSCGPFWIGGLNLSFKCLGYAIIPSSGVEELHILHIPVLVFCSSWVNPFGQLLQLEMKSALTPLYFRVLFITWRCGFVDITKSLDRVMLAIWAITSIVATAFGCQPSIPSGSISFSAEIV